MINDYGEVKGSANDRVTWRAITRQLSTYEYDMMMMMMMMAVM